MSQHEQPNRTPQPQEPKNQQQPPLSKKRLKGIILFVIVLLFQLGLLFAYGFSGRFLQTGRTTIQLYAALLIVLVGYGLLVSSSRHGVSIGMATSLLVVAVNVQLSPLLQKFWYLVFFNGFENDASATAATTTIFAFYEQRLNTFISDYVIFLALMQSVSFMAGTIGFIGKLRVLQTYILSLIFNITWPLSLCLNILVFNGSESTSSSFFDGFGINTIYIFGAFFGLGVMFSYYRFSQPKPSSKDIGYPRSSSMFGLMGTGFIFALFPFVRSQLIALLATQLNINARLRVGTLSIYLALAASVATTYAASSLIRGFGRVGVNEATLGVLCGGVMISGAAGYILNPGGVIIVGCIAGIVAGVMLGLVTQKMNSQDVKDVYGLTSSYATASFIGGFIVVPIVIASHFDVGNMSGVFVGSTVANLDDPPYVLAYVAISLGIGLLSGLLGGFICGTTQDPSPYEDEMFFGLDYGLYRATAKKESVQAESGVRLQENRT